MRDNFFKFNIFRVKRRLKGYCRSILGEGVFLTSRLSQLFWGYKVEGHSIIGSLPCTCLNDFEFDFNTVIGKSLFYRGSFELEEIAYFSEVLKKLDSQPVIFDIGANIGVHGISWAKMHEKSVVYAFEPSENTMSMLRRNIERNRVLDRFFAVRKAVSNESGEMSFYECADNAFSGLKDTGRVRVIGTQTVPVTTIDDFVEENKIEKINFIKIDVEGFETEVVLGGMNTLENFKPDLFIEIYAGENANLAPEETISLLQRLGYYAYVFSDGKMNQYKQHTDELYNYYFTMNRLSIEDE